MQCSLHILLALTRHLSIGDLQHSTAHACRDRQCSGGASWCATGPTSLTMSNTCRHGHLVTSPPDCVRWHQMTPLQLTCLQTQLAPFRQAGTGELKHQHRWPWLGRDILSPPTSTHSLHTMVTMVTQKNACSYINTQYKSLPLQGHQTLLHNRTVRHPHHLVALLLAPLPLSALPSSSNPKPSQLTLIMSASASPSRVGTCRKELMQSLLLPSNTHGQWELCSMRACRM